MSGWGAYIPGMGVDLSDFVPASAATGLRTRYCAHCFCSQYTDADEACWQCGGDTTPDKPACWPSSNSGVTVRGGDSWQPSEEENDVSSESMVQETREVRGGEHGPPSVPGLSERYEDAFACDSEA